MSSLSAKRPVASLSFLDGENLRTEETLSANTTVIVGTKKELEELKPGFFQDYLGLFKGFSSSDQKPRPLILETLLRGLPAKGGSSTSSLVEAVNLSLIHI